MDLYYFINLRIINKTANASYMNETLSVVMLLCIEIKFYLSNILLGVHFLKMSKDLRKSAKFFRKMAHFELARKTKPSKLQVKLGMTNTDVQAIQIE